MTYSCANCSIYACRQEDRSRMPLNCPMRNTVVQEEAFALYAEKDNHEFYVKCSEIEALGYTVWPRVKETIQFCLSMGYRKVGIAFCWGLRKEAKVVNDLLVKAGLEVVSVVCKTGGHDKTTVGLSDSQKIRPGNFEAMCNPIAQAKLLNEAGTEFNILIGLCVGHDSMFIKYSDAMVTTLVAKDRCTGNNPAAAIYCAEGYFSKRL